MSGDTATWVGSIATGVGVAMAWWFALKSNKSQKAAETAAATAQKATRDHAEHLQRRELDHAERLKREDREHAERLEGDRSEREEAARKQEHTAKARDLFVAICSLPKVDGRGEHYSEANAKAAELYAHIGNSPRARYIVTTAMACFSYGNEGGDTGRTQKLQEEREAVDRYFAGLDPELPIPTAGAVRNFAKPPPAGTAESPGLRGKLWLLKPDD